MKHKKYKVYYIDDSGPEEDTIIADSLSEAINEFFDEDDIKYYSSSASNMCSIPSYSPHSIIPKCDGRNVMVFATDSTTTIIGLEGFEFDSVVKKVSSLDTHVYKEYSAFV